MNFKTWMRTIAPVLFAGLAIPVQQAISCSNCKYIEPIRDAASTAS